MLREGFVAVAVLSLTLAAGCADAPAPAATFPGQAAPPRRVTAWHQFCEQAWSMSQVNTALGVRGADGWELVGLSNGVMCFKRPAADGEVRTPSGVNYVPVVRDPGF